jgi:uroporphyrinogen-III synthase
MRVLVTRALADSENVAEILRSRGHEAVIAPILVIRFLSGDPIVTDGVQAVLATSRYGVKGLALRTKRRDLPLLAVGSETAGVARDAGFAHVHDAGADGRSLARLVSRRLRPEDGTLLHAAGRNRSSSLLAPLEADGFTVKSLVLYEADAAEHLPEGVYRRLRAGTLDAVLFFSPRTAEIFSTIAEKEDVAACCKSLIACCISGAAALAAGAVAFREVRVAAHPDQSSLLALLE